MQTKMLPANIWILEITEEIRKRLRQVISLEIYDGSTANFHPQGLYSVEIFGRMGLDERDFRFGLMDLKVPIFHPKIFRDLIRLKQLYGEILAGRSTAVFDEATNDFVASNAQEARTGYSFFVEHFPRLEFKRNKSATRSERIALIDKYRSKAMTKYMVVMPAGLRDIEVSETGRAAKHEINDIYYKVLSIANTIPAGGDHNSSVYDISRYSLTLAFGEIYSLIEQMLEGKKGFLLNKWASRRVLYGNRNVLTSMDTSAPRLNSINAPGLDATVMGIYQVAKSITPKTIYYLRQRFIFKTFTEYDAAVSLIDKRTLKPELVNVSPETRDTWTTVEGLNSVINVLSEPELRHTPVEIEGRYLALVYADANTFKIFFDIDDLPEGFDAKYVKPVTYLEMIYLSAFEVWNQHPAEISRYPITGVESTVPSFTYVKTTTRSSMKTMLGDDWKPLADKIALEYPERDLHSFIDTLCPHPSRLSGLMADFDGDTGSNICPMTDEAIEENRLLLSTRRAWIDQDGRPRADLGYDTLNLLVRNMTGRFPK